MYYWGNIQAIIIAAAVLNTAFLIFVIVFMVTVMTRLREVRDQTALLNRHMAAIRYPNAGWPDPYEDIILLEQPRGGPHRLYADGHWERFVDGRWVECLPPGHERNPRWRMF